VRRALRHTGAEVLPILAPTPALGYRVRARLHVRDGRLGYASARSHRGAALTRCPVMHPALASVLLDDGPAIAGALGEGGALAGLVGGAADAPSVHLAVQLAAGGRAGQVRDFLRRLLAAGRIAGASLTTPAASTPEIFGAAAIALGSAPDLPPLWASADGFAQASAAGHELLPRLVRDLVGAPADGRRWPRLLELYAGSGNLTRALLPLTDELVAVEGDAAAASRLMRWRDSQSADGPRLSIRSQPVEQALAAAVRAGDRFDAVVLDPPRTGARPALPWLGRLGVRRLVYVSCDAMTLGRDLVALGALGLRARCVLPLDLVPHTAQLECVAVLDADDPSD
jgi:23S rRNA (uracil1939-C5)-methyltransferase